mmetsp:Transcript_2817/g.7923  ORF Transcript_2817/g.7923 Transcript_2817/m.7923 type:complete len:611 (-) Transcript_2817:30-1862(-)
MGGNADGVVDPPLADLLWMQWGVQQELQGSVLPPPRGFAQAPTPSQAFQCSLAIGDTAACFASGEKRDKRLARRHFFAAGLLDRELRELGLEGLAAAGGGSLPSSPVLPVGAAPAEGDAGPLGHADAGARRLFELSSLQAGDRVQVWGLRGAVELNGRTGLAVCPAPAAPQGRQERPCQAAGAAGQRWGVLLDADLGDSVSECPGRCWDSLLDEGTAATLPLKSIRRGHLSVVQKRRLRTESSGAGATVSGAEVEAAWRDINGKVGGSWQAAPGPTLYARVYVALYRGRMEAHLRRAAELDPGWRAPYLELAALHEECGDAGRAREAARLAVERGVLWSEFQRPLVFFPGLRASAWWTAAASGGERGGDPGPGAGPAAPEGAEEQGGLQLDGPSAEWVRELEQRGFEQVVMPEFRRLLARGDGFDGVGGDVGGDHRTGGQHDGSVLGRGRWREVNLFAKDEELGEDPDADAAAQRHFPRTRAYLERLVPQAVRMARLGMGEIIISRLSPGTHITPHCAPNNMRLTAHLALEVPAEAGAAQIRVGGAWRPWRLGRVLLFDDSFEHEVWHQGDTARVVLLIRFWHPDIPAARRRVVLQDDVRDRRLKAWWWW